MQQEKSLLLLHRMPETTKGLWDSSQTMQKGQKVQKEKKKSRC
jgi:hypothetical protein